MNNIVHLTDNNTQGTPIPRESIQDVLHISNIGRLQNAPDLLVFPHSFSEVKDGIGTLSIVTLHDAQYNDGKCISAKACTGNLMGFVGVNQRVMSFNGWRDTEEDIQKKVLMAKYTPNFDQELWKYQGLEILGAEYDWR